MHHPKFGIKIDGIYKWNGDENSGPEGDRSKRRMQKLK
jgi:hypothetical protein